MKSEMHRRCLPRGAGLGGAAGLQTWRVPGDPPASLSVPLSSPLIKASVREQLPNLKIGSAGEQQKRRGAGEGRKAISHKSLKGDLGRVTARANLEGRMRGSTLAFQSG